MTQFQGQGATFLNLDFNLFNRSTNGVVGSEDVFRILKVLLTFGHISTMFCPRPRMLDTVQYKLRH